MSRDVYVLGVSMSRHDRAACLLKNGSVVGAIAEERLDRRKRSLGKHGHAAGHIVLPPLAAITYVLRKEAISLADVDLVVCGRSMVQCREALRALGARSIVASPLIPGIKERLNAAIKYREAYRPFGISGTREGLAELVDTETCPASLAGYMLAAGHVKDDRLAEVRHADGVMRYQVVDPGLQPEWHQLIEAFGRLAAAGYVEAAVQLLDQKQYTVETAMGDGLEALQHYHGLMLRAAQQRGDVEAARDHAGNVLRWAGLSPEAAHAAQVIAGDQSVDDGHRLAASLIGGLGTPGAALDLFGTTLLAKPAGVATRRESA